MIEFKENGKYIATLKYWENFYRFIIENKGSSRWESS